MESASEAPPPVDLMFLLSQASHALTTELTAELAQVGISLRGYCVLSKALGADLTQVRLAELCALDKTTMVVTVDELERAGFARRLPCSTDRRARIIEVTPSGEWVVATASEIVNRVYEDVLAAVPAEDRQGFVNGLCQLAGGRLAHPVQCDRPVRRRMPRSPQKSVP